MLAINTIPQQYQNDLERAVKILKQGGCSEVYLFGSLTTGEFDERSDIDLAMVEITATGSVVHSLLY